ncbi:MAG: DUF4282 domain-containing protein [Deltaproteobacteria bacterium]|nr:DUF4282 domain-containing protein [Deltaproteobacteria bacterium]
MFCNYCGASNDNDAEFCINCGGSLSKLRRVKMLFHKRLFNTVFSLHKDPFLQALIDTSFNQLVSLKIIKRIYGLSILFAGLVAVLFIIAGFRTSPWFGIFVLLIGAPLIFLLIVLYSRIFLEMILVNFRRADHKIKKEEQPESVDSIEWNIKSSLIDDGCQTTEIRFRSPVMKE